MAAYTVVDVKVTNLEQLTEYRKLSVAAFEANGVKPLLAAGATDRLEGREPGLIVVLPFDSMAAARNFDELDEYRKARSAREGRYNYEYADRRRRMNSPAARRAGHEPLITAAMRRGVIRDPARVVDLMGSESRAVGAHLPRSRRSQRSRSVHLCGTQDWRPDPIQLAPFVALSPVACEAYS